MSLEKTLLIVGISVGIVTIPTLIIGCFHQLKEKNQVDRPVSSYEQQGGTTFGDLKANQITNSFNSGANEEVVKGLKDELEKVKAKSENQKYERAAGFSNYCTFTGGVSFTSSDSTIASLMRSSMVPLGDGKYNILCGGEVISNLGKVIEKVPSCPYPYFHLAYCYKENNDPRWEENALKAKEIFEKTTSVEGHNPLHESALKNVIEILSGTK